MIKHIVTSAAISAAALAGDADCRRGVTLSDIAFIWNPGDCAGGIIQAGACFIRALARGTVSPPRAGGGQGQVALAVPGSVRQFAAAAKSTRIIYRPASIATERKKCR